MNKLMLLAVVAAALYGPVAARADTVTTWNRTMVAALDTAGTPPPPAMRAAAIVQVSVFDAVNGIARRYTAVHVQPAAPHGASRAAAAASAAHEALVALFPAQQATFDQRLAETLAQLSDDDGGGQSIARGLTWGKTVADQILAWRASDGFSALLPPYLPAATPGRWQPTPPAFAGPLFRQFATMTPWALTSPSQFLPAAPPPLSSAQYARDFNEVKTLGSLTSTLRTPFQTETAKFWQADTPAAIWDRVADDLAERSDASLLTNARVLALTNMALADAVIAIRNAKNNFDTWRPEVVARAIGRIVVDSEEDEQRSLRDLPFLGDGRFHRASLAREDKSLCVLYHLGLRRRCAHQLLDLRELGHPRCPHPLDRGVEVVRCAPELDLRPEQRPVGVGGLELLTASRHCLG